MVDGRRPAGGLFLESLAATGFILHLHSTFATFNSCNYTSHCFNAQQKERERCIKIQRQHLAGGADVS